MSRVLSTSRVDERVRALRIEDPRARYCEIVSAALSGAVLLLLSWPRRLAPFTRDWARR
jgi:hypothetical protein